MIVVCSYVPNKGGAKLVDSGKKNKSPRTCQILAGTVRLVKGKIIFSRKKSSDIIKCLPQMSYLAEIKSSLLDRKKGKPKISVATNELIEKAQLPQVLMRFYKKLKF